MGLSKPTANLFLDKRRKNKHGKYPVKLTVYFLGVKSRYKLPHYYDDEEWRKINSPRLKDHKLKEEKIKLDYYAGDKFVNALKRIGDPFTFEKFENVYFKTSKLEDKSTDVYTKFEQIIEQKKNSGNIGTATVYNSSLNSFKKFRKKLKFDEITPKFLDDYESRQTTAGYSVSYISINLRNLRSVYNSAIIDGIADEKMYPFSRMKNDKKYQIKTSIRRKIALNSDELALLKQYNPETENEKRAFLIWWLSFHTNGMNVKDICLLRKTDIKDGFLQYRRSKTSNRTQQSQPIRIHISKTLSVILEELQGKNMTSPYYFDFLSETDDEKIIRKKVQNLTRLVNNYMKKIARKKLGINKDITTNIARHSFATYLSKNNTPLVQISYALGHTNLRTTQIYIATIDDSELIKQSQKLEEI